MVARAASDRTAVVATGARVRDVALAPIFLDAPGFALARVAVAAASGRRQPDAVARLQL
jgi:hypothetical protein